jgi:hypothetical protein
MTVDSSTRRVLETILEFGFRLIKKQYFDPILAVSIKMYLVPGFQSYTFDIHMNVELKKACR